MSDNVFFRYAKKVLSLFTIQHLDFLVYQVNPSAYQKQVDAKVEFNLKVEKFFPFTTVYEATIDGKVINHGELHSFNYLLWQLGFGMANVIGDCVTIPDYQGQGIYPAMLNRIIHDIKTGDKANSPVFIMVLPENTPSIKGIERAGFLFDFHFRGTRLGPFLIRKELGKSKEPTR